MYGGGNWDAFVTKINAAGSAWVYSTYLGGSANDYGYAISVDSADNAYVAGGTTSSDFPTTPGAYQTTTCSPCEEAFVTKLNADGSTLVYSTYLGGSRDGSAYGIAVDATGNAYVTGGTTSTDFPLINPIQSTIGGGYDAFVTKINAVGTALAYSTYLGGSGFDEGFGIAVDTTGNAYVLGETGSTNFPVANAIQSTFGGGTWDAFVTKINAAGNAWVYSTYLGGGGYDYPGRIATDTAGTAYGTGFTNSKNFPKTAAAFQRSLAGTSDSFVVKIAAQTFVSVSPLRLTFSTQVVGTTSVSKKVTLVNNGASALTINKIYFAATNPGDFAETNTCANSLASGATCSISVSFTPTAKNKRQAAMVISDSDPASPQAIPLSGTATVVSLSKSRLVFGDQAVGTTSPPQTVTLTNVGSTPLSFTGISIIGLNNAEFTETNTCLPAIAAKASCTITVTFTPTATGTRKAGVSIKDDGGGSPQVVYLTGTGT
jgi:hypothetical protein